MAAPVSSASPPPPTATPPGSPRVGGAPHHPPPAPRGAPGPGPGGDGHGEPTTAARPRPRGRAAPLLIAQPVLLAREDARVTAADVSDERLVALVAEHPDRELVPVVGDSTTEDGVQAIVAAADGRVDVLANVAGIMDGFLPAAEVDDRTWD
uniref:SDR family NAD(P)-dependent oxidoreductase n=1 Tax=Clavibacter michiganensis TaxID=28447 RepID=UPI00292CFA86